MDFPPDWEIYPCGRIRGSSSPHTRGSSSGANSTSPWQWTYSGPLASCPGQRHFPSGMCAANKIYPASCLGRLEPEVSVLGSWCHNPPQHDHQHPGQHLQDDQLQGGDGQRWHGGARGPGSSPGSAAEQQHGGCHQMGGGDRGGLPAMAPPAVFAGQVGDPLWQTDSERVSIILLAINLQAPCDCKSVFLFRYKDKCYHISA